MKYTVDIEIDLPKEKVIELFDNPENMTKWQKGFISLVHMSGEPGQVGAKSKLKYKMGKRDIEMVETIISRDLPKEFSATYEAKGVWNRIDNEFHDTTEGNTKWIAHQEFEFKGFMKLMGFLMPGMFKKQSCKYLEDFKAFAETGQSVN